MIIDATRRNGMPGSASCPVWRLCLVAGLVLLPMADLKAETRGNPSLGLSFMRTHCASCHAIGRVGASPLAIAPPFRDLHRRYPVENLAEAFAEGITTGHPTMPEFRLEPDQIENVIAYLKTLERP